MIEAQREAAAGALTEEIFEALETDDPRAAVYHVARRWLLRHATPATRLPEAHIGPCASYGAPGVRAGGLLVHCDPTLPAGRLELRADGELVGVLQFEREGTADAE